MKFHHDNELRVLTLMPFRGDLSFVYELGVKNAIDQLGKNCDINIILKRADEWLATKNTKVVEIQKEINSQDLLIVDISGYTPNVMWELGYCQALKKPVIVLNSNPIDTGKSPLPFNIANVDTVPYELSHSGVLQLTDSIVKFGEKVIRELKKEKGSLANDHQFMDNYNPIRGYLGRLMADSIVKSLAKNEIIRLKDRMHNLTHGRFQLRNEKPLKEITKYYCDYLAQLKGKDCEFKAITLPKFWNAITDNGTNSDYLQANKSAAAREVFIKRIFVTYDDFSTMEEKKHYESVISEHQALAAKRPNVEVKVINARSRQAAEQSYVNFAILKKKDESLLYLPKYTAHEEMERTDFYYTSDEIDSEQEVEEQIRKYLEIFEDSWE